MNVSDKQEKPQKVEVTGVKVAKRVKVIVGILVALLLVGGATLFGVNQYQKKRQQRNMSKGLNHIRLIWSWLHTQYLLGQVMLRYVEIS